MLNKTSKFAVFSAVQYDVQATQFDIVFADFDYKESCDASLLERKTTNSQSVMCLTYGEISSITPMRNIFNLIRKHDGLSASGGKFYDLGSGIGKPVIAAAVLHSFDVCIGIEILNNLHSIALQVKNKYDSLINLNNDYPMVEFHCGSILSLTPEQGGVDWTDGDIIFANSTCYDADMMIQLSSLGSRVKSGTYFITLSRPLQQCDGFKLLEEARYDMSWGMADYYLHIKE